MAIYGWTPGIGDPGVLGWVTVAVYFLAAACSWWAGAAPDQSYRGFWYVLTALLTALGINKQLDLQSLLTAVGRHVARTGGWYERRGEVQAEFIAVIAVAAVACSALMAWHLRRAGEWVGLAAVGMVLLIAFVLIRAASFHHVDRLLSVGLPGANINHLTELGSLVIIAVAALQARRSRAAPTA